MITVQQAAEAFARYLETGKEEDKKIVVKYFEDECEEESQD